MALPRIVVAAPGSGQGKTTLSMGVMAALKKRGLCVQPYKVGPDYIDPAFHAAVTGRPGINLDSWLLDGGYIKRMFATYSEDADISVIEGVMGLYDGVGSDPVNGSTAGLALLLEAPVLLVLQAKGMSCSAAALVHGMQTFRNVGIKAVVVNKPASLSHYGTIRQAIEKNTGVKVVGYLPECGDIELKSRHLGLVQSSETEALPMLIDKLAGLIEAHVDVAALIKMAGEAAGIAAEPLEKPACGEAAPRIAVALDKAFDFYYHENFQVLKRLGASLEFFSPLKDERLPEGCRGLYLGGGYPEVFAGELEANGGIRREIRERALGGMPVLAECGGYMYLNRSVRMDRAEAYEMVGVFEGNAYMTPKLQNFGYAEAEAIADTPFLKCGESVRIHEFHKSLIERDSPEYCIKVEKRRNGLLTEWRCGMTRERVFGMYPHIYFPSNMKIAARFVEACRHTEY